LALGWPKDWLPWSFISDCVRNGERRLLGYSTSRWLVGGVVCLLVLVCPSFSFLHSPSRRFRSPGLRLNAWFESGSHVWAARFSSWWPAGLPGNLPAQLSFPAPPFRPLILWLALCSWSPRLDILVFPQPLHPSPPGLLLTVNSVSFFSSVVHRCRIFRLLSPKFTRRRNASHF